MSIDAVIFGSTVPTEQFRSSAAGSSPRQRRFH
jgi:hypothetical protein